MKKTLTRKVPFILMLLFVPVLAMSQDGKERIEAAKIGLISERLGLTTEEAQRFWPIYNEYSIKRRENHEAFQQARRNYNPETATEEQTKSMLELGRHTKERQLNLEKEYSDRLLNVISTKQMMSLQNAEREFKGMLLRKLEHRNNQNMPDDQQRRENFERMKNKRQN